MVNVGFVCSLTELMCSRIGLCLAAPVLTWTLQGKKTVEVSSFFFFFLSRIARCLTLNSTAQYLGFLYAKMKIKSEYTNVEFFSFKFFLDCVRLSEAVSQYF